MGLTGYEWEKMYNKVHELNQKLIQENKLLRRRLAVLEVEGK